MYSRSRTNSFISAISALCDRLDAADAVLIGAGAGLSAAAGFAYSGERFHRYFADFQKKYGIQDMYSGGFHSFASPEEYWAWWSRQIWVNRYDVGVGQPYLDLLALVRDKEYFVLTTNVDHQFQKAGFDKERLFYTQGDYGLWQCSKPCHNKTYDNEAAVHRMILLQKDMRIPTDLVPRCPRCGAPMTMNLRCDEKFVQDEGWEQACARYEAFLNRHGADQTVYLELGVGFNTPGIIKVPFWKRTAANPQATYICINQGQAFCPEELENQSLCLNEDLAQALSAARLQRTGTPLE